MLLINLVARRVGLLVLGLLIGGLVVSGFSKRWGEDAPRSLSIELPYVGLGDGTLLRLPDGKVMVIDSPGPLRPGGWDPGRDVMAKILERRGVERIDVVVMTHPHWDHVGGFDYLSRRFSISEVWIGGELPKKNSRLARILERIRAQGGRVIVARDLARRFERGEITIEVIHPLRSSSPADDLNDDSLVLRLVYGERSILFTGDMTSRVERLRVARWLPTDIVKVPHHGSDTSSSEAFIRQVATEVALVSCAAEQREGIPSVDVLERYRRQGAKVLRTDLDGTISLWTDGKEWRVRTRQQADALVDINPR
jgi:competence protein ComEC